MPHVRFYFAVVGEDSSRQPFDSKVGVHHPRVGPAVDGNVFTKDISVAAGAMATIWDTGVATDFNVLVVETSGSDVMLELTANVSNSVGDEHLTIKLSPGIPFILGSDVSYANYTPGFGGGSLSKIDRVRCKNLGSSATRVEVMSVT